VAQVVRLFWRGDAASTLQAIASSEFGRSLIVWVWNNIGPAPQSVIDEAEQARQSEERDRRSQIERPEIDPGQLQGLVDAYIPDFADPGAEQRAGAAAQLPLDAVSGLRFGAVKDWQADPWYLSPAATKFANEWFLADGVRRLAATVIDRASEQGRLTDPGAALLAAQWVKIREQWEEYHPTAQNPGANGFLAHYALPDFEDGNPSYQTPNARVQDPPLRKHVPNWMRATNKLKVPPPFPAKKIEKLGKKFGGWGIPERFIEIGPRTFDPVTLRAPKLVSVVGNHVRRYLDTVRAALMDAEPLPRYIVDAINENLYSGEGRRLTFFDSGYDGPNINVI
jgi:hypothetical protein